MNESSVDAIKQGGDDLLRPPDLSDNNLPGIG